MDMCIKSLQAQRITDWTATLMVDKSDDDSLDKAKGWEAEDSRISVFSNAARMGVCFNLWRGIQLAGKDPDDIICCVDLDDFLAPDALQAVSDEYGNKDIMCTYGSYIRESSGKKSRDCRKAIYSDIDPAKVRKGPWRYSHLKTFKFGIMKHIPREYFMHNNEWGVAASDLALMFSVIETVGFPRCRCIDKPIYIYRDKSEIALNRLTQMKWARRFRKKDPLPRRY
jgi:glycosyltransferase involved in cell wall biosynthesis